MSEVETLKAAIEEASDAMFPNIQVILAEAEKSENLVQLLACQAICGVMSKLTSHIGAKA